MSPSGNLDWVWYGAGVVLALLGLILAYWSLLHDRARGRRRCPKCWYDMSSPGPDPLTCPECGKTANQERELSKICRSRNKGLAAILLVIVSCVIGTRPKWRDGQWALYIPTTVLVRVAPLCENYWKLEAPERYSGFFDKPKSTLTEELFRRLILEEKPEDRHHWKILIGRLQSNPSPRIPKIFHARTKWPRDFPISFYLTQNQLLNTSSIPITIRSRLNRDGREWHTYNYSRKSFKLIDGYSGTEPLPSDLDQVSFELEYYRSGSLVWEGESLPIELVDSIDEIMTPDDSIELEENIRSKIRLELRPIPNFPFNIELTKSDGFKWTSVTWGLRLEVRNRDLVVATGYRLFAQSIFGTLHDLSESSRVHLKWERDALLRACEDLDPQWRIVLVGDPEIALYDLGSNQYWSGEIELPFDWSEIERWCIYYNNEN